MKGMLTYWVGEGKNMLRTLRLTVCDAGDSGAGGMAEIRRRRLARIINEAAAQGARLSYRDLNMIMLVSRATLKRDMNRLKSAGVLPQAWGAQLQGQQRQEKGQ